MRLSEVKQTIAYAYKAKTHISLHGAPGIGKTAIVRAAWELLQVELEDPDLQWLPLRVNLCEPSDFLGVLWPQPGTGVVSWLTPDFIPKEGTKGILFLDEFPQATMSTQCAAMRLVDHLPDGWLAVTAGNRATDRAGAGQVATHVLSRFTHLEVDASREDWQEWAATTGNIRPEVRAFIDYVPAALFEFDPKKVQEERANASPRSWERVSRLMSVVPAKQRSEVFAGTIGVARAAEFIGYLRVFEECPAPDLILREPTKTLVPKEPSALFAVCAALSDRAKSLDKKGLSPLMTYLARLPIEFGALLMTDIIRTNNLALQVPEATKWVIAHQEVIASPRK